MFGDQEGYVVVQINVGYFGFFFENGDVYFGFWWFDLYGQVLVEV